MPKEKDTRTRIMEAAFELFIESSYKNVSVDDVAKRAGVSKGGLFHHFPTKYDLGRDALVHFATEHMGSAMGGGFEKLPPEDQIRHFIEMSVDIIVKDINMGRLFIDLYEEAWNREEEIEVWIEFLQGYVTLIEGIFAKMGVKNPRMRALIMFSSIDGFAMYYMMLVKAGEDVDMEQFKKELFRLYLGDD